MEVKCNQCGKTFDYKGGINHFNRNKNHYCSNRCQSDHNKTHGLATKGNADKRYKIWCGSKKRAKIKGIEFDLKPTDIPQIPKYCPVLGIKIKANTTHKPLDSSPSIDRIDSTKGYVKGNIRIISNRANRIKADATVEELRKVLEDYERIQT